LIRTLGAMMFIVGTLGSLAVLITRRPTGGGLRPA
jgi:hypothetical protein